MHGISSSARFQAQGGEAGRHQIAKVVGALGAVVEGILVIAEVAVWHPASRPAPPPARGARCVGIDHFRGEVR